MSAAQTWQALGIPSWRRKKSTGKCDSGLQCEQYSNSIQTMMLNRRVLVGIILVMPLLCVGVAGAPPASVVGMIYQERFTFGIRFYEDRLIEFGKDGVFTELAYSGGDRPIGYSYPYPLSSTVGTGKYIYTVVGPNIATLRLLNSNGQTLRMDGGPLYPDSDDIIFQGDLHGVIRGGAGWGGTFTFSSGAVDAPMVNQSSRAFVESDRPLRSGFVLRHRSYVLVRAVGPGLQQFGISNAARDPALAIAAGSFEVGNNDNWGVERVDVRRLAQLVGAFPLQAGSQDAAMFVLLPAGAYIATAKVPPGDGGEVLLEIYLLASQ